MSIFITYSEQFWSNHLLLVLRALGFTEYPLERRHNGCDGVSNHQPHDCWLNHLFSAYQRKHQSSASLAFVSGIQQWPVNSPHKWPPTRKMFPFDDVIMPWQYILCSHWSRRYVVFIIVLHIVVWEVIFSNATYCNNLFVIIVALYSILSYKYPAL